MAHAGGAHGGDAWVPGLGRLIAEEPEPRDLPAAIGPLAQLGVDVAAVQAEADRYLGLAEVDWHADDWRRSHPEFPGQYAAAAYIYTHEGLGVYRVLGEAMHDGARGAGPGGASPMMRACLPFIKLLDAGLVEAAIVWGFFVGQTLRGVKYAFPRPTAADHDPERHFPAGREFHWFEFNSSATNPQVMYRPYFCGRRGPRTIFYIQSCEGVSVKKFSAIPDEEEVLFRPLARFRVTGCTKQLTEGDLRDDVHPDNGFPDNVQLQQLSTFDPMAVLRARAAQFRMVRSLGDRRRGLKRERERRGEIEVLNAQLHQEIERLRAQVDAAVAAADRERLRVARLERELAAARLERQGGGGRRSALGGGVIPGSAIAAAAQHRAGAVLRGRVLAFGRNEYGALGDGSTTHRRSPVEIASLGGDNAQVAAGQCHSLILKTDGRVLAFGDNGSGQLGDGSTTHRRSPVEIASLGGDNAQVAAGGYHSLVLRGVS